MKRTAVICLVFGAIAFATGIASDDFVIRRRMKEQHRNWITVQEYLLLETLKVIGWVGILGGLVIQSLPNRSVTGRSGGFEVIEKK